MTVLTKLWRDPDRNLVIYSSLAGFVLIAVVTVAVAWLGLDTKPDWFAPLGGN